MFSRHDGEVRLDNSFKRTYNWLAENGPADLTTKKRGTSFTSEAAITQSGPHSGEQVIRFRQKGKVYARAYACCWGRYYNCNGTRMGMYCTALDASVLQLEEPPKTQELGQIPDENQYQPETPVPAHPDVKTVSQMDAIQAQQDKLISRVRELELEIQKLESQYDRNVRRLDALQHSARLRSEPGEVAIHTKHYGSIFDAVESTLISVGSRNKPEDEIRAKLDEFRRVEGKTFSDREYYQTLVSVIFYSGFKAATVTPRLPAIHSHFPDYQTVATYGNDKIEEILSYPGIIRHRNKVKACVSNAGTFKGIVAKHSSFQKYVESFAATESFENLMLLKEEFEYRFKGLGEITTYHFLMDIGLPVLKPDSAIRRIFRRLGFIENDGQLLKTVIQGRRFAQATGHPIRYVDIVFVTYGQLQSSDLGIEKGICLRVNPTCSICGVTNYCDYYRDRNVSV